MTKLLHIQKLLLGALLLETFSISFGFHIASAAAVLSVLYMLSGLAIAVLFLRMPSMGKQQAAGQGITVKMIVIAALLLAAFVFFGRQRMMAEPLTYESADMLPIIKIMNERMLAGHFSQVYEPIPEIWNGAKPIYLPAMWMPFAVPVVLKLDPRWLTVACLFVVYLLLLFQIRFSKKEWVLLAGGMALAGWLFIDDIPGLIPFSEEGVVILYYSLLVVALQRNHFTAIAVLTAFCLLSRYSLVGWLPAFLLWLIWHRRFKHSFSMALTGVATILLLVLPFSWAAMAQLFQLPASYIAFAVRVWHNSPEVFIAGPGLARFFGPNHITTQHNLLIACSLLVPVTITFLCLRFARFWRINKEHLPVAMLKLSLVVFLSLVDVPYDYLFYTSSFVSLLMLAPVMRRPK